MKEIKNTALDFDDCVGVRNKEEAPATLADFLGFDEVPSTEDAAWKELWKGMPKFEQAPQVHRTLTFNFRSDEDYEEFIKMIGYKHITNKTKTVWYPESPKIDNYLTRFIDGE